MKKQKLVIIPVKVTPAEKRELARGARKLKRGNVSALLRDSALEKVRRNRT